MRRINKRRVERSEQSVSIFVIRDFGSVVILETVTEVLVERTSGSDKKLRVNVDKLEAIFRRIVIVRRRKARAKAHAADRLRRRPPEIRRHLKHVLGRLTLIRDDERKRVRVRRRIVIDIAFYSG